MKEVIISRIHKALELTNDYYLNLSEEQLLLKIQNAPSNSIRDQVWCIIGARESYTKALMKGEWDGFSCSLSDAKNKELIMSKLQETFSKLEDVLDEKIQPDMNVLFDLLEHEVQHHGQLIRYAYANRIGFPKSWNERYTV